MQFMLLLCNSTEGAPEPEAFQGIMADFTKILDALRASGALIATQGLMPSAQGRTVRTAKTGIRVHDGPYAETREEVGGYVLIDVADIDAATGWAGRYVEAAERRLPGTDGFGIEVRQIRG